MAKQVTFNGVTYRSNRAIAKAFGISPNLFAKRQKAGWTMEQTLGLVDPPRWGRGEIAFNGKTYPGLAALCDDLGLNLKAVHQRITAGWTLEEAIGAKEKKIRHRHKPIIFDGVEYDSLKALAEAHELNYMTFFNRYLRSEWTLRQCLGIDPPPDLQGVPADFGGVTYISIPALHRALSHEAAVDEKIFRGRLANALRNGRTLTDDIILAAIRAPLARPNGGGEIYVIRNKINEKVYVGLTVQSIEERFAEHKADASNGHERNPDGLHYAMWSLGIDNFFCEKLDDAETSKELSRKEDEWILRLGSLAPNGYNLVRGGAVGASAVRGFTYNGENFRNRTAAVKVLAARHNLSTGCVSSRIEKEIPLDLPLHGGAKKTIHAFGVEYKSIAEAARAFGLSNGLFHCRIKSGMSVEEALTTPVRDKGITFNGIHYQQIADLPAAYGIDPQVFYKRRHTGWSIEEALELVPRPSQVWIEHGGKTYRSIAELCAEFGIDRSLFHRRIALGWTIEEALSPDKWVRNKRLAA